MTDSSLIFAADGGGTGCRARLCTPDGQLLAEASAGPANITSDFDGALRSLQQALAELFARAGLPPSPVGLVAHLGLAGANASPRSEEVLFRLGLTRARISSDRDTTVQGALGDSEGLVALFGTGSFFAARRGGDLSYLGGWGLVLGDVGGGAWMGRQALRLALRAHDGQRAQSPLTQDLLAHFGSAAQMVSWAASATPQDFAAHAPEVLNAFHAADPAAQEILRATQDELLSALSQLDPQGDLPLCLMGGLSEALRATLPPALQQRCAPPQGTPLDGAVQLAQNLLRAGAA